MGNWKFVARETDVAPGVPRHVSADGVDAVLLDIDGELRAFEGWGISP